MQKFLTKLIYLCFISFFSLMFLGDFIYAVPKHISKNEVSKTLEFKSNEHRGVWFSYIDWINLIEASCKNNELDENRFIKLVEQIFKNLKSIGINVIYVHLRAFGDAFYKSKLAAKSKYLKNLNFDKLDPLKVFIKFARENSIQIHGWINPMRAFLNRDIDSLPNDYNLKKWFEEPLRKKYYLGLAENKWWVLNPCNGEVIKLILDVVDEILTNYDVDGIHIDDYFYPSEISKTNYDSSFYNEIKPQNCSIEKFRFLGVSNLVKLIKKKCVELKPNSIFSVAVIGNIEVNKKLFADIYDWLVNGYVDIIIPEIYYSCSAKYTKKPFAQCLNDWNNLVNDVKKINPNAFDKTKILVGLAAYKLYIDDEGWKNNDEILKQQELLCKQNLNYYNGYCLFDYKSIFNMNGEPNQPGFKAVKLLNELF